VKEANMGRPWERLAAIAGVLFFVVVIMSFWTPSTPDADDPTAKIVQDIADDRTGLILGAYLGGIASVLFLVFTAGLWSRIRAAEPERGPATLTLLGGLGSAVMILVANGALLALVDAADERRELEAVRALFELSEVLFIGIGFTSAVFYGGVALSALATRSLPAWLGWSAAALAVTFPVALLGVFSKDDEGGVLGAVFFIALLVNFLWILAASIVMLRASPAAPAAATRMPA
jgi:hypothetical protein